MGIYITFIKHPDQSLLCLFHLRDLLEMSQLSAEDEAELESLLKQLLESINDRISGAPSTECAEEVLLRLEETDKNFHK